MQRILLVQTAFLGDVILTTPLIRAIRQTYPSCHLDIVVNQEAASVLKDNPALSGVLVLDKKGRHRGAGFFRFIKEIKDRHYDLLLSPHESHRSAILAGLSGIPERIGYRSAGFALAYTRTVERRLELPEVERLLAFFKDAMGIQTTFDPYPELFSTAESDRRASDLLQSYGARQPILIAPSSVWATKRWPVWHFSQLIRLLLAAEKSPVFLIGSHADRKLSAEIIKLLKYMVPDAQQKRVIDLCGQTSFAVLFSLVRKSRLLISNDSAPVHFAQAARIPIVCIMGPTTPALGYAPVTPESLVAGVDLPCRPCGTHGSHVCPLGHFQCMERLEPDYVFSLARKALLEPAKERNATGPSAVQQSGPHSAGGVR